MTPDPKADETTATDAQTRKDCEMERDQITDEQRRFLLDTYSVTKSEDAKAAVLAAVNRLRDRLKMDRGQAAAAAAEAGCGPMGESPEPPNETTRALQQAYRAIRGLYGAIANGRKPDDAMIAYHSLTLAAAMRFVSDDELVAPDFFTGKPVGVLHSYLAMYVETPLAGPPAKDGCGPMKEAPETSPAT